MAAAGGLPNGSIPVLRFLLANPGATEDQIAAGAALPAQEVYVVLERFEKSGWTEFADGYTLTERGAWVAENV